MTLQLKLYFSFPMKPQTNRFAKKFLLHCFLSVTLRIN